MTLNRIKLGRSVTFMKFSSSVVENLLNFGELVENELMQSISKKFTNIPFSIRFIVAYWKDFKGL